MQYVVERFANINELIRANYTRHPNRVFEGKKLCSEEIEELSGWYKTRTYDDAVELLKNGYEEPLAKIKRGVELNAKRRATQKTSVKNDIVGYAPCVPAAILGIPQSMINKEISPKKAKVITIVYDVVSNAATKTEDFINSGIAVLSIINSLEVNGYRVSLEVLVDNAVADTERTYASVVLKDWRQPLDLKKMAFPFCHPSMLRRIGLKWLETTPKLTDRGYIDGYGSSVSSGRDYAAVVKELRDNNLISEHQKFINIKVCKENDFNPQKVAKACGLE